MHLHAIRPRPGFVKIGIAVFGLLVGSAYSQNEGASAFGTEPTGEAALIGMLYDLKQDQGRHPKEVDAASYTKIIDEFLTRNWDESILNRYFRAGRALSVTQIFIPPMPASGGPRAFGVSAIVKPNFFLAHYKGQVLAPQPGTYRFVGFGDNVLVVAVDGKTVLVANKSDIVFPTFKWSSTGTGARAGGGGNLINGDWMQIEANQILDIDVLIGESHGGISAYFLMIEKQGENYPLDQRGHPILPIFQVAENRLVDPKTANIPKFSNNPIIWKCLQ